MRPAGRAGAANGRGRLWQTTTCGAGNGAMSQRLRLNPIACEAHGMCGELLPERVTLDEWGYPIVDERPLDASLIENARRAAAACPTFALLLERGPTRRGAAAPCGCPRPGASRTGGRGAALPNRSSALLA